MHGARVPEEPLRFVDTLEAFRAVVGGFGWYRESASVHGVIRVEAVAVPGEPGFSGLGEIPHPSELSLLGVVIATEVKPRRTCLLHPGDPIDVCRRLGDYSMWYLCVAADGDPRSLAALLRALEAEHRRPRTWCFRRDPAHDHAERRRRLRLVR